MLKKIQENGGNGVPSYFKDYLEAESKIIRNTDNNTFQ